MRGTKWVRFVVAGVLSSSMMWLCSCASDVFPGDVPHDAIWGGADSPSIDRPREDVSGVLDSPAPKDNEFSDASTDQCARYQSCRSCTGSLMCGWCRTACVSGTSAGSTIPGRCKESDWIWIGRGCPL